MNAEERSELIARHLNGELNDSEKERLVEILDNDPSFRSELVEESLFDSRLVEVLRGKTQKQKTDNGIYESLNPPTSNWKLWASFALASAAMVIAALMIQNALWSGGSDATDPAIARITGISGPLQWTGNEGRVFRQLTAGTKLSGGTIDGLSPESWFELEFNDGSKVVISGNSMLTFSDIGQKKLYLKGGSISASVEPQPANKPMLIHTRSAVLEVLGTEFEVKADMASTLLNVNEGKVRLKRFSDGGSIDVPAKHRVVAAADRDLKLERVPDSVNHWTSQIQTTPKGAFGDWSSKKNEEPARLNAITYTTEDGYTIFTVGVGVSGESSPVKLSNNSRFRVQGMLDKQSHVCFGLNLNHPNGDFAGRFQVFSKDKMEAGAFELELELSQFELDPSLKKMEDKLPANPTGLIVDAAWCHTMFDNAGLAITDIEILAP